MRIIIFIVFIIAIVTIGAGCEKYISPNTDNSIIKVNKENTLIDSIDEVENNEEVNDAALDRVNNIANANYQNLDEAFENEVIKYENNKSSDSLFCIYIIISNNNKYCSYLTKYYKEILDRSLTDEIFKEESRISISETSIDYLRQLLEEGKYEEFQEFYRNIPIYINEPVIWFNVLSWYKREGIKLTQEEQDLHLQALYEYERKYTEDIPLSVLTLMYGLISELADALGEEDIKVSYQEKQDDAYTMLTGMSQEFKSEWAIDIKLLSYKEKEIQLNELVKYEEKYSMYWHAPLYLDLYRRISDIAYELGDDEKGEIYAEKYNEASNQDPS